MNYFKRITPCFLVILLMCLHPFYAIAVEWDSELTAFFKTRFEFSDDENNANLYSYFNYDVREKKNNFPRFHFSGWLRKDIYSEDNGAGYDTIQVTQAFIEHKFSFADLKVTVGRHTPGKVEEFWIDGLQLGVSKGENGLSVYGGKPITFYEIDYDEDFLFGFSFQLNHTSRTRFNVDAFFVKEGSQWHDNCIASIYKFIPQYSTRAYLRMRANEFKLEDLFFKLSVLPPKYNTLVSLDYFLQNKSEEDSSDRYIGYNNVFGQRYGYHKFGISFQQPLWETLFFNAQLTLKRSVGNTEEKYDWMNIDSNIITAGLHQYEFFHPNLSVGVFGNYIDNSDNDFYDVSGIVDYGFKDQHNISAGITFTGYSYGDLTFSDILNGQDSVYELYGHVGSKIYFMEYEFKFKNNRKLSFQVAFEDNNSPYQNATIVNLKYRY